MKKKRQRLVVVQVTAGADGAGTRDTGATGADDAGSGAGATTAIVPVEGGSIEELLATWRVAQIQPLGPLPAADGTEPRYLALLLLEEIAAEEGLGRLGFGAT